MDPKEYREWGIRESRCYRLYGEGTTRVNLICTMGED